MESMSTKAEEKDKYTKDVDYEKKKISILIFFWVSSKTHEEPLVKGKQYLL